jgi:hypothetical protein
MPLFLKSESEFEPSSSFVGQTFYSDDLLGAWAKPTGIYIPPGVNLDHGVVDVLIWLHGWYVTDVEKLLTKDRAAVRQQVLASGKRVVLVAPWLGEGGKGDKSTYNTKDIAGHWGERYLDQVLGALSVMRDPRTDQPPWKRTSPSNVGLSRASDYPPGLRLRRLAIACHSAGGVPMRKLVDTLGRYKANLRECWGFGCLYKTSADPDDDATFWYNWVTGKNGRPLYISYGTSTVPQSVKLYLMGQGLVDRTGGRRVPEGPEVMPLTVSLGVSTPKYIDDLMGLDKLLMATTPNVRRAPSVGNEFATLAANSLKQNVHWPGDEMEMHYRMPATVCSNA